MKSLTLAYIHRYSALISLDDKGFTWGKNHQMMEGLALVGSTHVLGHQKAPKHEILPREVESLREVKAVACSHLHTAFIAN